MLLKPNATAGLLALLLLVLAPISAFAQLSDPVPFRWTNNPPTQSSSTPIPSLESTEFLPVEEAYQLVPNLTTDGQLQLTWDIADGYYLYQRQLKIVDLEEDANLEFDAPPGEMKYDDYFEEHLRVYYHSLTLQPGTRFDPSERSHRLAIHSQGCADAGLCYPPQIQYVEINENGAQLLDASGTPEATNNNLLPDSVRPDNVKHSFAPGYWVTAIIGALLGGLLLNLMPCVFPVLSLKVLSLANAHEQPNQRHLHGWCYTLGSISFFVLLATLMLWLRHAGMAVGWGFQLQSPVFIGALVYLFFIMGVLMSTSTGFGSQLAGIGQRLTIGHGPASSFWTGALACLVASPCTAPFMGAAVGFAVTRPAPVALSVFAALGLGMAIPFLLLSYFPKLLNRLPKPGPWMVTFKQLLAFPLYLTALWLLWVMGRQSGSDAIIWTALGLLGVVFAGWLYHRAGHKRFLRWIPTLMFLLALLPLCKVTEPHQRQAKMSGAWEPYHPQRLEQLLQERTPVFVNLTADWCLTCLSNEKLAIETERVQQVFRDAGIVQLKGDWTNYDPAITELLSQFGRNGVPLYLLYSGEPGVPPQVLPQILNTHTITGAVDKMTNHRRTAMDTRQKSAEDA